MLSFLQRLRRRLRTRVPPARAYDLWSATYDDQTDNVVMLLEQGLFGDLVQGLVLRDKVVVDVGCGTGRHWPRLLAAGPSRLIGYDASAGMLARLRAKYPDAAVHVADGHELRATPDASCDAVVSSLTLGYLQDAGSAIAEWRRVLKPGGDLVVTDFHPAAAADGDRSFRHGAEVINIRHHVHALDALAAAAARNDLEQLHFQEAVIGEPVRRFFEAHGSLDVFERRRGEPLVYGFHFRRRPAPQAS